MIASVRRRNVERLCDKYSIGPDLRQSEPTAAALFHVRTDHLNLGGFEGRRPSKQSFFFRALEERTLFQSAKRDGCEGGFPALALPPNRDARSHDGLLFKHEKALIANLYINAYGYNHPHWTWKHTIGIGRSDDPHGSSIARGRACLDRRGLLSQLQPPHLRRGARALCGKGQHPRDCPALLSDPRQIRTL